MTRRILEMAVGISRLMAQIETLDTPFRTSTRTRDGRLENGRDSREGTSATENHCCCGKRLLHKAKSIVLGFCFL